MKIRKTKITLTFIIGIVISLASAFVVLSTSQPNNNEANAATTSSLSGKSVLFDGDSIAMGSAACGNATTCGGNSSGKYSYADYIRIAYNTNNTNVSMGGARFYWPDYSTDSNCYHDQDCVIPNHLTSTEKNTEYDYIILEGGVNDLHFYYKNNPENYYSALRSYFDTVTTNPQWAHAKIGFVIAPKFDYNRKTWYDHDLEATFRRETQNICDEYSIEYINFFKRESDDGFVVPSGFNNWSFTDTVIDNESDSDEIGSYDGLHPSKGAHEMLGGYIASWMVGLPNYKYTVSFSSNGSSLSGAASQSIVHGQKATAPTYTIDDDEIFNYWSEESSCGTEFNFNTAISKDTILYACWEQKPDPTHSYTLSFDTNGGTGTIAAQTCSTTGNSCSVTIPSTIPAHSSYYFLGYADVANATTPIYQPGDSIALSADKTIYAVWADGGAEWQSNEDYETGSGEDMVIRINYPIEHFVKLMIDNIEVDNTNGDKYKIESGSTIITVYSDHLDTLEPGEHTLQAVYDNGITKGINFTIKANDPDTPTDPDDPDDPATPDDPDTPADPDTPTDPDDSDDPSESDDSTESDDEESPSVPSTAGKPDTGSNTHDDDGAVVLCGLPIAIILVTGSIFVLKKNRHHRVFKW